MLLFVAVVAISCAVYVSKRSGLSDRQLVFVAGSGAQRHLECSYAHMELVNDLKNLDYQYVEQPSWWRSVSIPPGERLSISPTILPTRTDWLIVNRDGVSCYICIASTNYFIYSHAYVYKPCLPHQDIEDELELQAEVVDEMSSLWNACLKDNVW